MMGMVVESSVVGNFYTNVTLVGAPREALLSALGSTGRRAALLFVGRFSVVYDEQADTQDGSNEQLAASLSSTLRCPAIAVTNHDDDVLVIECFEEGRRTDSYNSKPDYFKWRAGGEPARPSGSDPSTLVRLCDAGEPSEVQAILGGEFLFEFLRHEALVRALGLPMATVNIGYSSIAADELVPGDLKKFVLLGD
jgi:hypothetical protein